MKKPTWKERFTYWFDNRMSKGTIAMIRILGIFTVLVIAVIASLVLITSGNHTKNDLSVEVTEESEPEEKIEAPEAFWDSFAYTVNSYIPNYGDAEGTSLWLYAIAGVIGLLITSVLIGVLSAGIEDRLEQLRKGNSRVLEQNHIVVLGFTKGEYTLLQQLVEGCDEKGGKIVIAEKMDRSEMEDALREGINCPKDIHFICRNADNTDPNSIDICSISDARAVVVNINDDHKVVKTLLAITSLIDPSSDHKPVIISTVSSSAYQLPEEMCRKYRIYMLKTYDIIARLIARSCRHPGLSNVFEELFSYEGSEFYLDPVTESAGKTFAWVMEHAVKGIPVGVMDNARTVLVPDGDRILHPGERLIIIEENADAAQCQSDHTCLVYESRISKPNGRKNKVIIIGINEVIDTVLDELPDDIHDVELASMFPITEEQKDALQEKHPDLQITVFNKDIRSTDQLRELVSGSKRIVLLSRHTIDAETSDINNMQLLLDLHAIRDQYHYRFTITAEMRREANKKLIARSDHADFVVATDISAMLMAQLVNQPDLYHVFSELLSHEGSELFLKSAGSFGCASIPLTFGSIRLAALKDRYICIGYRRTVDAVPLITINPDVDQTITLEPRDCLIMMGRYH